MEQLLISMGYQVKTYHLTNNSSKDTSYIKKWSERDLDKLKEILLVDNLDDEKIVLLFTKQNGFFQIPKKSSDKDLRQILENNGECNICFENNKEMNICNYCNNEICIDCYEKIETVGLSLDMCKLIKCPFCREVI